METRPGGGRARSLEVSTDIMATLRFQVHGEIGSITLSGFLGQLEDHLSMLQEYDMAISHERHSTLEWLITKVSSGSLILETESRSTLPEKDFGNDVIEAYFTGWGRIEHEGSSPPYLSEKGMVAARRIVQRIGKDGMTGVAISSSHRRITLAASAFENVERLVSKIDESPGSAEGTLETVSIHGSSRFTIYHSRTKKAIRCDIPKGSDLLDQAKEALGSRVLVAGILHTNVCGEPLRILANTLRVFPENRELPSIASLGGRYPELTGDVTTSDFIRSIRDR